VNIDFDLMLDKTTLWGVGIRPIQNFNCRSAEKQMFGKSADIARYYYLGCKIDEYIIRE
jgi:hypothetical protein